MTKRRLRTARKREALGSLERFRGVPEYVVGLYGERADAIRKAAAAGATVSEIAAVLGISRKVVYDSIRNGKGERSQ